MLDTKALSSSLLSGSMSGPELGDAVRLQPILTASNTYYEMFKR